MNLENGKYSILFNEVEIIMQVHDNQVNVENVFKVRF